MKSVKESKSESNRRSWLARPILASEFTEDTPLQEVYVGVLKNKKDISKVIQSLSTILPGFSHLKRCSNNRVILTSPNLADLSRIVSEESHEPSTEEKLKILLRDKGFDLSLLEDNLQVLKVPAKSPKTKAQAHTASKIWPIDFHPDPFLETIIDGSIFSEEQLGVIENYMMAAITAAKLEAIGNAHCNGSSIIMDPQDGKFLAIAASRIDRHPMWHAAMLAVDLIAVLHGGGAWHLKNDCVSNDKYISEREDSRRESESCENTSGNFQSRMKAIKRKYEEEAPLFYPKSLSQIPLPKMQSLKPKEKRKGGRNNEAKKIENLLELGKTECSDPSNLNEKCGPYLCTGYWVFLLQEPCPMCAMALLHSRVAAIFYGVANEKTGVLGSNVSLHTLPGLNHRYRVWAGILEQECRQVLAEIQHRNVD